MRASIFARAPGFSAQSAVPYRTNPYVRSSISHNCRLKPTACAAHARAYRTVKEESLWNRKRALCARLICNGDGTGTHAASRVHHPLIRPDGWFIEYRRPSVLNHAPISLNRLIDPARPERTVHFRRSILFDDLSSLSRQKVSLLFKATLSAIHRRLSRSV